MHTRSTGPYSPSHLADEPAERDADKPQRLIDWAREELGIEEDTSRYEGEGVTTWYFNLGRWIRKVTPEEIPRSGS